MVYFQRGKSRVPSLKNTVKFILSEPVRSPGRGVFPKELLPGSEGGRRGSWGGSGVRTSCAPCFEFAIFGNFCKRCTWCYSIVQDGIRRQAQKTKLKNSLIQPRTSQKKLSLFENASRALRAFPKGKIHQKLRTFGYPPFMQKLYFCLCIV